MVLLVRARETEAQQAKELRMFDLQLWG